MNAYDALESRANASGGGMSLFTGAQKSEDQKMRDFGRALGGMAVEQDDGAGEEAAEAQDVVEVAEAEAGDAAAPSSLNEQDRAALAADGWSDAEIAEMPREMAIRAASRAQERARRDRPSAEGSGQQGAQASGLDLDSLEAELKEDLGAKTTKILMDRLVRPMAQSHQGVAASAAQARVEQAVQANIRLYPELARAGVRQAAVEAAVRMQRAGESDAQTLRRALVDLYGDRKAEARAQTGQQMSPPGRSAAKPQKPTRDQANIAALKAFEKNGDRAGAVRVRKQLGY